METGGNGLFLMTPKAPENRNSARSLAKVAAALLLFAGLSFLAGCQGVSAGNSNPVLGTLSLPNPSLAFGNVAPGSSKTVSVTATNTGTAAVNVTSVSISSKYFTLAAPSLPMSIAAGQSTPISLTFNPNTTGAFNATMTIGSNASDAQTMVALSGTGATPSSGTLASNPTTEAFGSVTDGTTQSQTVTLNNTGTATVNISQVAVSGAGFQVSGIATPLALSPSQSTSFTISFDPQTAGSATGSVSITSDASDSTMTIALSGTGVTAGTLGSNPASLSFGSVSAGANQSLSETVTNTGGSSVTISAVAASGTGFSVSGITAPVTLAAGQGTTFSVKFAPASAGSATGNLTVSSNASNATLTIPLNGTGITAGALGSNPASLSFGNVQVGVTQGLTETVTNTGTTSVTISAVAASGTGFSISGITAPVTLTAGQGATFSVGFDPASAGSATGSVTVTSTATNPTLTIPLTGTGVTPGTVGANPTSLSFGSVVVGANEALTESLTNTGGSNVTISGVAASGTGFSASGISPPVTLTPGQVATFSVKFTPASAGSASGNVTVTSNGSNPTLTIPLSGTGLAGGALGSNPTSLSFGNVQVGSSQSLSETVTNTGSASVTISAVAASGTGFSLSGITTPVTLTAGQGATFSVKFTPASAASASGNVTVTSNASNPTLTIPLSGTGTAAAGVLAVTPSTLPIGSVVVGANGTGSGSLMATGSNVTVSSVSSNNGAFSVSGITLPVTITAGQSVPFTVTYSPQSTGAVSATLTFTSNAQTTTTQETVTGTGTAAPVHTVSLTWNASSSTDVSGYNIYRAPYTSTCGSFAKINPSLNAGTAYTDSNVTDGSSYCYAATTVDTSNNESGYSNIVSDIQIPAP